MRYLKDVHILAPLAVGGLALLSSWIGAYLEFFEIKEKIIMHVNFQEEIDLMGARKEIFMILFIYFILYAGGGWLSYGTYKREKFMSYMLSYSVAFIALISLFYVYTLAKLN